MSKVVVNIFEVAINGLPREIRPPMGNTLDSMNSVRGSPCSHVVEFFDQLDCIFTIREELAGRPAIRVTVLQSKKNGTELSIRSEAQVSLTAPARRMTF